MEIKLESVYELLARAMVLKFYGGINWPSRESFAAYERSNGIMSVLDALFGREWIDSMRSKVSPSYIEKEMAKHSPPNIEDGLRRDNLILADFFLEVSEAIRRGQGNDGHSLVELVKSKRAKGE